MGKKLAITLAGSAVGDLEELKAWYVDQNVPDVAERLLAEVFLHIETLADFPESGRVVPEFGIARLREIIHPPFRIVYRIEETRIRVVRVWRSERLLKLPQGGR
jgi:toxin ParE1/3/4